ncbi:MAG: SDR family oxidoreductase [Acidobacteriota bacterium]
MKIVILGGTGLIGRPLVEILRAQHHEVLAASPSNGVNTLTGDGLTAALQGASVVIDVTNSPSFADADVLSFFQTSAAHVHPAEAAAGVRHHIALSVIGCDRLPDSGYMRAKVAQEKAIAASGIPYTILRATQFFEFIGPTANAGEQNGKVVVPTAFMQPIAAADVSAALSHFPTADPINGVVEIAGPEKLRIDELVRRLFLLQHDARPIVADPNALYFGTRVTDESLVPHGPHQTGPTRYNDWLQRTIAKS